MAIETINSEVSKVYTKELARQENEIRGCKIDIKEDSVIILVPFGSDPSTYKSLVFSKKDMRKLLEELYVM